MSGSATLFLEMNCRNALVFKIGSSIWPHIVSYQIFGFEITKMKSLIGDQCFFGIEIFKVVNCIVRVHLVLDAS